MSTKLQVIAGGHFPYPRTGCRRSPKALPRHNLGRRVPMSVAIRRPPLPPRTSRQSSNPGGRVAPSIRTPHLWEASPTPILPSREAATPCSQLASAPGYRSDHSPGRATHAATGTTGCPNHFCGAKQSIQVRRNERQRFGTKPAMSFYCHSVRIQLPLPAAPPRLRTTGGTQTATGHRRVPFAPCPAGAYYHSPG